MVGRSHGRFTLLRESELRFTSPVTIPNFVLSQRDHDNESQHHNTTDISYASWERATFTFARAWRKEILVDNTVCTMEDEDWEYEYDENETEDIYFTLDLTTHVTPTLSSRKGPLVKSNKGLKSVNSIRTKAKETNNVTALEDSPAATPDLGPAISESAPGKMQVVDLHSNNPLISYNNAFYSCHWATDVGTSVLLSSPKADPDQDHPPFRSFRSFDLLGLTSARLMAVPATMRPRIVPLDTGRKHWPTYDTVTKTPEGDKIHQSARHGIRIELPTNASAEKVSQARFLERWSVIKKAKGQRDPIPVKGIRTYTLPEGWEMEKQEHLAKEAAERGDIEDREVEDEEQCIGPTTEHEHDGRSVVARDEDGSQGGTPGVVGDFERSSTAGKRRRGTKEAESATKEPPEPGDAPPKKKQVRWRGPTGRQPGRPRRIRLDNGQSPGPSVKLTGDDRQNSLDATPDVET